MNLSQNTRAWIYRVALAVLPLLVLYGVLAAEDVPLWAALVGSVLVPGLAVANTPTGTHRAP